MKTILAALALFLAATPLMAADPKEAGLYELRVYWAAEGKLDALHARFRDHTLKLFEKHGMTNIAYFVPVDNTDSRLIYIVRHKDKAAADASWKAFAADEEWKKAFAESEKNGKLVTKAQRIWLTKTDFSPEKPVPSKEDRVFELRTYVTTPDHLPNLLARFKDHTVKLFEKHGMTNIAYSTIAEGDKTTNGQLLKATTGAGDDKVDAKADEVAKPTALIYFLAHKDKDAAKKSFDAFRADPVWVTAKTESETKAGGSLTVKDGVKSLFLKPTDYSPFK